MNFRMVHFMFKDNQLSSTSLIVCKRANRSHWCPLRWLFFREYRWNILEIFFKNLLKNLCIILLRFVLKIRQKHVIFKVFQVHLQVLDMPSRDNSFFYITFDHMWQWKGFQLVIIVDLPLVPFLVVHHNHCVINELCWFLQP